MMNIAWFKDLDQAFKKFLEENNIKDKIFGILKDLDVDNNEELQNASNKIKEIILNVEIPSSIKDDIIDAYDTLNVDKELFEKAKEALAIIKAGRDMPYVAVRSSATAEDLPEASFAGQQATFLNVRGNQNLLYAVKKCWASLYTARAIYYRIKNNFPHEKVLIAVIIQKQIHSDKSGVIFTVNPLNNNENEILIEAGFGLGDAVVSGSIIPDQYILDKGDLRLKEKETGKQEWKLEFDFNTKETVKKKIDVKRRILEEYEIKNLGELARKIEQHYKKPQDIEYAIEGNKVYIVQSRPITTLKKVAKKVSEDVSDRKVILKGMSASPGIYSGPVKILNSMEELGKVNDGDILVAVQTNPDFVPAMKRAKAIVTDSGGSTSHAAIVSREMGIPCVVGTDKATEILKDGDIITVNGSKGEVYEGKVEVKQEVEEHREVMGGVETITKIKVIMDIPDLADKVAETGAEGIGLVRLEIMISEGGVHPRKYIEDDREEEYIELLVNGIKKMAEAFKGKPVWVRTSDLRTDEYRGLEGGEEEPKETDPMIGNHGIRRVLKQQGILKAEVKALKRLHEEGYNNVGVMIPFVINLDEVVKAKEIMREIGLEPCKDIDFGVMIETPASCWIIEDICKEGVSFVSFGTNDLTQLTLGVDRNNEDIAYLFNEKHPAVLGEIKKVIDTCKKYNVETSLCGQSGSDPEMAEFLVKFGIDSISANPDAVDRIKEVVARTEKKLLLDFARRRNS